MQRRRSSAHTFEDRIAAEKARLEAQVAKLKPGPQMDVVASRSGEVVGIFAAEKKNRASQPLPSVNLLGSKAIDFSS